MQRFSPFLITASLYSLMACGSSPNDPTNPTNPTTNGNACGTEVVWYRDVDNDGYGDPQVTSDDCEVPLGYVDNGLDCNDDDKDINPDAVEVCDEEDDDENCDGLADNDDPAAEGTIETWVDLDMDGYGVEGPTTWYCDPPPDAAQNALDCDDTLPGAWPGAAFEDSLIDCMNDADGDGYGDVNGSGSVTPGTDCSDDDPGAYPGALETWTDGIDQDCDGSDQYGYVDDLETGTIEDTIWDSVLGAAITQAATVNQWALEFTPGSSMRTVPADTTLCPALDYSIKVKRGLASAPSASDRLAIQWKDDTGVFRSLTAVVGDGTIDPTFVTVSGQLTDATALQNDFGIRIENIGTGTFFVDDIVIGCPGPDLDGDGVPGLADCNDNDAAHWDDCGACVDLDGDGYGTDCNLGGDCDDNDASVNPTGPDAPGDSLDANCDGFDGVVLLETFEAGSLSNSTWPVQVGDVWVTNLDVIGGNFSARLGPTGLAGLLLPSSGELTSRAMDLSLCPELSWYMRARRGPNAPDATDSLSIQVWDGLDWITTDTWVGSQFNDDFESERFGSSSLAGVLTAGAQWRLVSDSPNGASFFVDDIVVGCPEDLDGDLRPAIVDCDDNDPDHWSDCGLCVDEDVDGFGLGCDLGVDCDDTDPSVNPLATEIVGDGLDQNCDLIDGLGMIDHFESGNLDPAIWARQSGDVEVVDGFAADGRHSVALRGDAATIETVSIDFSTCPAVVWHWDVRRGPEAPDPSATLSFEVWNGTGWVRVASSVGTGADDADWINDFDVTPDPTFLNTNAAARLVVTGGTPGQDTFYVDYFGYMCGSRDMDGDGYPPPLDCDDSSPFNWDDCWTCIDPDGDGYGVDCNIEIEDCNPNDASAYPGAPDPIGDGLDTNCDGVDGVRLFDDFESGLYDPEIWQSFTGDTYVGTDYALSGQYSLNLGGDIGEVVSVPMLTGGCSQVNVNLWIKRGPETPDGGDFLWLDYWTGSTWVNALTYEGVGVTENDFSLVQLELFGPDATHNDLQFRFSSAGSGANFDDFFIDDFEAYCPEADADLDGVPDADDCAPNDPLHWSDCGLCVDLDGDGYGVSCDLGTDCDDSASGINPGATEIYNDGIDQDCSGSDAEALLFDDFESGTWDPLWWFSATGDQLIDTAYSTSGMFSAKLGGGGSTVVSIDMDSSICTNGIYWSFEGKRGPETPDANDAVTFYYKNDLGAYTQFFYYEGIGITENGFTFYDGTIFSASAQHTTFSLQMISNGSGLSFDHFFIDDIFLGCL